MRRYAAGLLLVLLWIIILSGCQADPGQHTRSTADTQPLVVAAASDLQFAFQEMAGIFQEQTGQPVVFTFGSTGNLARQVAQGAPVDMLVVADVRSVRELGEKGLIIPDTEQVYAIGKPVLVFQEGAVTGMWEDGLDRLLDPEVKRVAIANPEHAPYGVAARQALIAAGLWPKLQPKLVYGESVLQALLFVQTGNAEAGIVALSVARVPGVNYTPIEESLYEPIQQALAVIRGTPREQAARDFISFINGPRGRDIMQAYGFSLAQ